MKIYVSGPMRGRPQNEVTLAFGQATALLRFQGHVVYSPNEEDILYGPPPLRECFARDMHWICMHADAVALLPEWETSTGARAEKALAEALGLAVIYLGQDS